MLAAVLSLLLAALPVTLAAGSRGTRCAHDEIARLAPRKAHQPGHANLYGEALHGGRRAAAAVFQPIRLVPIYVGASSLPTWQRTLVESLLGAAIKRWTGLLAVQPVVGNLFATRDCTSHSTQGTFPDNCASYATDTACGGVGSDTYISFTNGYSQYLEGAPGAVGLANADHGLFVTVIQTEGVCGTSAGGGTIAYTINCQRDRYDRPTWSRINICPGMLSTTTSSDATAFADLAATVMHELGHALGFTSSSFALFRDSENNPRTPRDPIIGGVSNAYEVNVPRCGTGIAAASNTIAYASERGTACSWNGASAATSNIPYGATGKTPLDCVARIVTPTVAAAAASFFACPGLAGAELENQDTSECFVQASHFEMRTLNTELMGAYAQHVALVSPILLAVFQDSGWYSANFSGADAYREGLEWGFRAGCEFASAKCSASNTGSYAEDNKPWYFDGASPPRSCGSGGSDCITHGSSLPAVCTTDRRAWGVVTLGLVSPLPPSTFQYVSGSPSLGSTAPGMDWCPSPQYGGRGRGLCSDASENAGTNVVIAMGETYGASSICLGSTLLKTTFSSGNRGAGCYEVVCSASSGGAPSVVINAGGSSVTCPRAGATVYISGFSGSITCPDAAVVCSAGNTYLPANLPIPSVFVTVTPSRTRTAFSTPTATLSPGASPSAAPFTLSVSILFGAASSPAPFLPLSDAVLSLLLSVAASAMSLPVSAISIPDVSPVYASELSTSGSATTLAGYRVVFVIAGDAAAASPIIAAAAGTTPSSYTNAQLVAGVASAVTSRVIVAVSDVPSLVSGLGYSSATVLRSAAVLDPTRPAGLVVPSSPPTARGDSSSSLAAAIGGGIAGGIVTFLLLAVIVAACLHKLPCQRAPNAILSSKSPEQGASPEIARTLQLATASSVRRDLSRANLGDANTS